MSLKVIIIGAGPAGLVTCKSLLENASEEYPFDPIVLEQEDDIGGTFRYRSYEVRLFSAVGNLDIVLDQHVEFPSRLLKATDMLLRLSSPNVPPRSHEFRGVLFLLLEIVRVMLIYLFQSYLDYLRAYARHFQLTERIKLNCKVVNVSRDHVTGEHLVSFVMRSLENPREWDQRQSCLCVTSASRMTYFSVVITLRARYLAVCTGLHVLPQFPKIEGIEHVENQSVKQGSGKSVFHSHEYKHRSQLADKRVMILGTGGEHTLV